WSRTRTIRAGRRPSTGAPRPSAGPTWPSAPSRSRRALTGSNSPSGRPSPGRGSPRRSFSPRWSRWRRGAGGRHEAGGALPALRSRHAGVLPPVPALRLDALRRPDARGPSRHARAAEDGLVRNPPPACRPGGHRPLAPDAAPPVRRGAAPRGAAPLEPVPVLRLPPLQQPAAASVLPAEPGPPCAPAPAPGLRPQPPAPLLLLGGGDVPAPPRERPQRRRGLGGRPPVDADRLQHVLVLDGNLHGRERVRPAGAARAAARAGVACTQAPG